jgi:hypothetical protein
VEVDVDAAEVVQQGGAAQVKDPQSRRRQDTSVFFMMKCGEHSAGKSPASGQIAPIPDDRQPRTQREEPQVRGGSVYSREKEG